MQYLATLFVTVVGILINFIQGVFNFVTLGVTLVLSRFILRIVVAIVFYTFVVAKLNTFMQYTTQLFLPPEMLKLLCMFGVAQAFNIIVSAFFVAMALRGVRRVILGA